MHRDLNPQLNEHWDFATLPGCRALYRAAWAIVKHNSCLTSDFWSYFSSYCFATLWSN